ncbi:hypothetical protein [Streptomyces sp. Ag109_G2-15]|uniref:hypothetical protein n=1 Tax=Streptomyces sp. Ag109_G2-15 TaxID=1938850 RepID=UPI000BCD4B2C|nr:hypothetical protein [Streptomyces sp. Ag109_G2-15]SOD86816.1 hypothetical protein SAMN06272765_4291 [Streptomyces sp. Ag109_G2-15]
MYDDLARDYGYEPDGGQMTGSPVVLEIWPAQHYSPIHSHGETTGIIYCLAGQLDVMSYSKLEWKAEKRALVTLTPGQCAWLTKQTNAVHKVSTTSTRRRRSQASSTPISDLSWTALRKALATTAAKW